MPALARILVPAAVAMALLMFHPLSISLQTSRDDSTTAAKEDPGRKWDFVTQWSWPPEESIDFIAPGFTGWRSGEETGPYGGRMGRSAGWEKTGQGFRNFKLENQYLGAIPIVFGFWACLAAWGFRKRREDGWGTVFFWGIATVVALVLSFGKYFPAYYFLYLLPGFSSVRNPNKFLQVFQLGVGLLAAFGFSRALEPETGSRMAGRLEKALWGAFALLGLAALGLFAGWGNAAAALAAEGWGVAADTMVRNRVWALAHGAGMLLGAALALRWLLIRPPGNAAWRQALPWLVVAVVAADVLALSRHYVKALPRSLIEENDVVRFLKRVRGHQRVTFITQESFYNAWLTYLFPYHGIPSVNVTQMPRMPGDYEAFLGAMRPQPLRMWEMMAAEFVVGPVQLWAQVQQDPALRDAFELVYAFNAEAAPDGGVRVSAATAERPGGHCVLRLKRPAPRYAALDSWRVLPDEDALRRISARDYAPFTEALLSPSTAAGVPGAPGTRAVSNVPVQHYRPGRVELKVSTDRPVVVRAAEKYDPGWRATVDGRPAPVYRCDRVFQGVPVEQGIHEVVLSYSNAVGAFRVQIAGMVLSLLAAASLAIRREPRPAA